MDVRTRSVRLPPRSDCVDQLSTVGQPSRPVERENQPAPNTLPSFSGAKGIPAEIARGTTTSAWTEPNVAAWVATSRLNLIGALADHANKPSVQVAIKRYLTHVHAAVDRLSQLDGST